MRFLLTCIPGLGHFNPLLPLARSLRNAGHDVAVATAPAFADVVMAAGFEIIAAGLDWDERRLLDTVPELRAVSKMNRGEWMMKHIFLDRSPRRMIADLRTIVPQWQPDMIVSGSFVRIWRSAGCGKGGSALCNGQLYSSLEPMGPQACARATNCAAAR
jgi:UDP:flavonoid glycosyltransferase YjiC (YdhE family)